MFSSNPNRQKHLSLAEFLKISAELDAKGQSFHADEPISITVSADSKALADKLIELIYAKKLPQQLTVTFSKEWYDNHVEFMDQIIQALAVANCPKGLEIRLDGMARDQNCFKKMSALLALNPHLIKVDFVEGDNCLYMEEDEVEKNIQAVSRLCTINKFILENPEKKHAIEHFASAKEQGLKPEVASQLFRDLDDALTQRVQVSHMVRK